MAQRGGVVPTLGRSATTDVAVRPLLCVDLDGVVADSFDVYSLAVVEACRRTGVESVLADSDVLALCQGDLYARLRELGADDAALAEIEQRVMRTIHNALPWVRPFPLMPQLLDELGDVCRVVVFSRYDAEVAAALLHRYRVTGVAEVIGLRPGESKAEQLGDVLRSSTPQEESWHVSGTTGDVRAARLAGALPCAVAWGWHEPQELLAAGAARLAETPPELLEIVVPSLKDDFWD